MTSTVLDVMLCLLLVSASVVAVTTANRGEPAGEGRAADVAETLATSTATVNYSLAVPASETVGSRSDAAMASRTAHGTLAGLLARATVGNAAIDGAGLSPSSVGFRGAVARRIASAIGTHTQVRTLWRPYVGSDVRGVVTVGARPPSEAAIHAATLTVPSGFTPASDAALVAGERDGYAGVATVTATHLVEGLFPPERTRFALQGATPSSNVSSARFRRAERFLDANRTTDLQRGGVYAANARLRDALASRIERRMNRSFENATAAARAVRVGRVTIVVRTWS